MHYSLEAVIQCLETLQADNIVTIDTRKTWPLCDEIIICTARSSTHARSLASSVYLYFKQNSIKAKVEGTEAGEWILVDSAGIMIHVMQSNIRSYYDLESLWSREVDFYTPQ